ncbi:hypothetical protein K435DRAFT_871047 [Dendrothele bispora CBS 962.96]|uniref:Uncharacterized protein n=1 Tax=Dendrothele bispora (strain CBS 962.96) TaxID=1314807 RepID=A0A4S8L530_DENBC|nr:hypothetical protein K435DRAFT_871047 [Dendrothele bispora CBS 962.96]
MPRETIHGRSVGNAARCGVRAPGGASHGRGPFTSARIFTPPTLDSLMAETRNRHHIQQQEELQDEPQDSTRTIRKRKRPHFSIANTSSKHKLSDRGSNDNKALEHLYQLAVRVIVKVGIALSGSFCDMEGMEDFGALEDKMDDYNGEQQCTLVGLFERGTLGRRYAW